MKAGVSAAVLEMCRMMRKHHQYASPEVTMPSNATMESACNEKFACGTAGKASGSSSAKEPRCVNVATGKGSSFVRARLVSGVARP